MYYGTEHTWELCFANDIMISHCKIVLKEYMLVT